MLSELASCSKPQSASDQDFQACVRYSSGTCLCLGELIVRLHGIMIQVLSNIGLVNDSCYAASLQSKAPECNQSQHISDVQSH